MLAMIKGAILSQVSTRRSSLCDTLLCSKTAKETAGFHIGKGWKDHSGKSWRERFACLSLPVISEEEIAVKYEQELEHF